MEGSRAPGQRAGLTRAGVLAEAQALIAESGLAALTMRTLATRLGVAPNALYSHVPTKTALVDGVLDEVLAEVAVPDLDAGGDWRDGLGEIMRSTYRVLLAHPDLVGLYLTRQGARGPNAHRLGDAMQVLLEAGGVRGAEAGEAQRALIVHAIGSAAFARAGDGQPVGSPTEELLVTFERSLQWLLAGIAGAGGPGDPDRDRVHARSRDGESRDLR